MIEMQTVISCKTSVDRSFLIQLNVSSRNDVLISQKVTVVLYLLDMYHQS